MYLVYIVTKKFLKIYLTASVVDLYVLFRLLVVSVKFSLEL